MRLARLFCIGAGLAVAVASVDTASAQAAKELTGTWLLVSIQSEADGKKVDVFGPNPKGIFAFDGSHFSVIITRNDLPKIASNNRMTATPEESKSIVQGSIAYFGTYQINDGEVNQKVEGSTFANYMTADQKRTFKIDGNNLTIGNSASSAGVGITVTLVRSK